MINETLKNYSKEQLIELIEGYCKNWLAMDGVWFQSVERKYGMDEAMEHDCAIWEKFTVIEAKRIKTFLNLPEHPGMEGLKQALKLRLYANINRDEIITEGNTLIYRTTECRVQHARSSKNMPLHPCKAVGIIEYSGFAKTIDSRFTCECLRRFFSAVFSKFIFSFFCKRCNCAARFPRCGFFYCSGSYKPVFIKINAGIFFKFHKTGVAVIRHVLLPKSRPELGILIQCPHFHCAIIVKFQN